MLVIIGGFDYRFGCSLPFLISLYIYFLFFFLFSLFESVYVHVSLCDFVCLVLILQFGFGLYLLGFFFFLFFQAVWLAGFLCSG